MPPGAGSRNGIATRFVPAPGPGPPQGPRAPQPGSSPGRGPTAPGPGRTLPGPHRAGAPAAASRLAPHRPRLGQEGAVPVHDLAPQGLVVGLPEVGVLLQQPPRHLAGLAEELRVPHGVRDAQRG